MKLVLDPRKTLLENAKVYHEEAKKYKAKAEGAQRAIQNTLGVIEHQAEAIAIVSARKKRAWFDQFHYFKTSRGNLVIGGRNAKQNDLIFSKHALPEETFLHAEIRGSPAVVIKANNPTDQELQEAAQFTASYSSAWKREFGNVDVYVVKVSQVSKHFQGGYLDQGAFAIAGERKWFKNTLLGMYICFNEETLVVSLTPAMSIPSGLFVKVTPGETPRNKVAKTIKSFFAKKLFEKGKKLKLDEAEIAKILPGDCNIDT